MWLPQDLSGREAELETIELFENTEPFVDVSQACPGILINMYASPHVTRDDNRALVRLGTALLLRKVEEALPAGIHLMVRDAWRSEKTQWGIHENQAVGMQDLGLAKDRASAEALADRYAARPDERYPAPHMTGGAVDVTLAFTSGTMLPMWKQTKDKEEYVAQRARDYQDLPKDVLLHRRMLRDAMESFGFASIPHEWWHFSYGDIWWAARKGLTRTFYLAVKKPYVLHIAIT